MSNFTQPPKRTIEESTVDTTATKKAKVESSYSDNGVREPDVGITLFLSSQIPGFAGQIKQRYTDFLVNEIDKEGKVVHLTDKGFKMPKKPQLSRDEVRANREEEASKR